MRQFSTVFAYTFRHQAGTRGWRTATVLMALLLFLLPALLPAALDRPDSQPQAEPVCRAQRLLVVDQAPGKADWSVLNQLGGLQLDYLPCESVNDAAAQAAAYDLIAVLYESDDGYLLTVLNPDESVLQPDDLAACEDFLSGALGLIQLQKAGLSPADIAVLAVPVSVELPDVDAAADSSAVLMEFLSMILPYCTIMLLYFMILFYGQSVATCAIAEKSSKLMDTFLVSVRPQAMMLGKVLAISLAAVLQLSIWIAALGCGVQAGAALLRSVNPASSSSFLLLADGLGLLQGAFRPAAIAVAVAIMLAGFLLYCALAAVGGALASKPEELSSTNLLFTLALIISFFCCLGGGGLLDSGGISAAWMDWVPFTAILATPSRVLLGQVSPLVGLGSLAVILAAAVLLCLLAGRLYRAMSFYRGTPPTPGRLLAMLRKN